MDARDASPAATAPEAGPALGHPRAAQPVIGAPQFLVLLDSLMVAVALPVIARELHLTTTQLPGWPPPGWSSCMPQQVDLPGYRGRTSGPGRLGGHAHATDQRLPRPQPPAPPVALVAAGVDLDLEAVSVLALSDHCGPSGHAVLAAKE